MRAEQALAYFKRRRDAMQLMEDDVAIWALEKQIPKKPIKDDDNVVCPMCGTIIGMSPYCAKCGQALDLGKRPINIYSADELKRLILEQQELPILVLAGDNANIGDYGFMSCSRVRAQEGEFLDCKQKIDACKCYTDRDDFEDDVADFLAGEEQYRDLPDDEFNSLVERTVNEYDDFWKPCILLLVDN